uniref:Uncharacterized protein n=1 Tax=Schistosoma japonicum TaxID=6182 RepID=Q5BQX5_SCHJA|nr:unknown [Schistosoma japonicum]
MYLFTQQFTTYLHCLRLVFKRKTLNSWVSMDKKLMKKPWKRETELKKKKKKNCNLYVVECEIIRKA